MDRISAVLLDPSASRWLRLNLEAALARDPVDAVNDADLLASLLDARLAEIQDEHDAEFFGEDDCNSQRCAECIEQLIEGRHAR